LNQQAEKGKKSREKRAERNSGTNEEKRTPIKFIFITLSKGLSAWCAPAQKLTLGSIDSNIAVVVLVLASTFFFNIQCCVSLRVRALKQFALPQMEPGPNAVLIARRSMAASHEINIVGVCVLLSIILFGFQQHARVRRARVHFGMGDLHAAGRGGRDNLICWGHTRAPKWDSML